MYIQEGSITTLTTCTKMTEEVDRRHGVNDDKCKGATEEVPEHSCAHLTSGGRLKFFKDGKFILELVQGSPREGERGGWVSVPRKTFWPPTAAPQTPPTPVHPPSQCLSISDDNSSIQSSPWQRDHCWKQANPRRNLSKELVMYYCRPSTLNTTSIASGSRSKRRRPYDTSHFDILLNGFRKPLSNGVCEKKRNGDIGITDKNGSTEDSVDGSVSTDVIGTKMSSVEDRWREYDKEKYYHMKLKKPYQYHKLKVYKKTGSVMKRKLLERTVDRLREKIASLPVPVYAKLASCRQEHTIVSPRKRILRELERVSLETRHDDQGSKRRAKTVPTLSTISYPPSPGPSQARSHDSVPRKEATKNVSSYSIHSLLSMPDESPTRRSPDAKRSPHSYTSSLKTESSSSAHSPDPSPSPDGFRYRYSALTLGSPSGVGNSHESPPPAPGVEISRYRVGSAYSSTASPYARAWPPYRGAEPASYVYGYGYAQSLYRAPPPPMWMHYAMSPAVPPGPWAPLAHPLLTDHIPRDEPTSDLPLNLSKH